MRKSHPASKWGQFVRLKPDTKAMLNMIGKKNESYDTIVRNLIKRRGKRLF